MRARPTPSPLRGGVVVRRVRVVPSLRARAGSLGSLRALLDPVGLRQVISRIDSRSLAFGTVVRVRGAMAPPAGAPSPPPEQPPSSSPSTATFGGSQASSGDPAAPAFSRRVGCSASPSRPSRFRWQRGPRSS